MLRARRDARDERRQESALGRFKALTPARQTALMAEFTIARANDPILAALYPDDKIVPIVWLSERLAGIRFSAIG